MLRVLLVLLFLGGNANATDLSSMKTIGNGQMTWVFWTAYDAELLSENGEYDASKPFALKLTYNMDFTGKDIAERSAEEIAKQREVGKDWLEKMLEIFPDVKKGDSITGIKTVDNESKFLFNGKEIGTVKDPKFTQAFFDIWLSEKTSEPSLRAKLLAGK